VPDKCQWTFGSVSFNWIYCILYYENSLLYCCDLLYYCLVDRKSRNWIESLDYLKFIVCPSREAWISRNIRKTIPSGQTISMMEFWTTASHSTFRTIGRHRRVAGDCVRGRVCVSLDLRVFNFKARFLKKQLMYLCKMHTYLQRLSTMAADKHLAECSFSCSTSSSLAWYRSSSAITASEVNDLDNDLQLISLKSAILYLSWSLRRSELAMCCKLTRCLACGFWSSWRGVET